MDNYKKITTKKDQSIDTWDICPHRSKAQSEGEENDPFDYRYTTIYRVESRHEFDNCKVDAAHKLFTTECLDWPMKPQMAKLQIPLNVFLDEIEEEREYYFLSVSFDRPRDQVCDDSVLRFSISIDSNVDRFKYLKVSDYKQSNLWIMMILLELLLNVLFLLYLLYKVFDLVCSLYSSL